MSTLHPAAPAPYPGTLPDTPAPPRPRSGRPLLYLVIVLLLPLLSVPCLIAFGSSDVFLHHGASLWVRSNDSVFTMHDRTCTTLLFGDSTAMTGLDPAIIATHTAGTACNIALTNAVLAVTGELALDRFLARNPRPHTLLIQLSPESFSVRAHPWQQTVYAEGLLELLRWSAPGVARHTLLTHPREALAFAGYVAGFTAFYAVKQGWQHLTGTRAGEDAVTIRNGFFTAPLPARTRCDYTLPAPGPADRAAAAALVRDLQQRYSGRVDHLLIDIAPIPACDANLPALRSGLDRLASSPLETLPIGLFNDQRHYTAAGADLLSRRAADQIRALPH